MVKKYKILHIPTGCYCLLFPLINNKYGMDFENTTVCWGGRESTISRRKWNYLWKHNKLKVNKIVSMSWSCVDEEINQVICKNEFELVAI